MLQRSFYTPSNRAEIMRYACRNGPLAYRTAPIGSTYPCVPPPRQPRGGTAPIVCAPKARAGCAVRRTSPLKAALKTAPVNRGPAQPAASAQPMAALAANPPQPVASIPTPPPPPPAPEPFHQMALSEREAPAPARAEAPGCCKDPENLEPVRRMTESMTKCEREIPRPDSEAVSEEAARCGCCGCDGCCGCGEEAGCAPDATSCDLFAKLRYDDCVDPCGEGLLYYQKFWYLNDVEISVNGELLCGTTLEFHENTLRLISDTHSYYIPLRQVDYIRTSDGLKTSFTDGRFGPITPLRVKPSMKCKIKRRPGPQKQKNPPDCQ